MNLPVKKSPTDKIMGEFHAKVAQLTAVAERQDHKAETSHTKCAYLTEVYLGLGRWLASLYTRQLTRLLGKRSECHAEAAKARAACTRIQKFLGEAN